ncbi:tyrosine-protein phosphatase [Actinoplanes sp. HUAS TT8]|uniref:tyrosine-protein phosphatase n=1 Tax=Actinoplanes sp. HUAS TT8 TaxID=3447453 RepID=UPI003F51FD44
MKLINACLACAVALSAGLTAAPASAHDRTGHHASHQDQSQHRIPFTAATVTQNADGTFTITWSAPGARNVTIYAGKAQDRIEHHKPVARGGEKATVTVKNLGEADRWWFELVPDRGESLTLADRSLHLASAPNFRDAGGYRTADGRWVRMGVIYRSNSLAALTGADVAELRRLGIRTDIDFRTPSEIATGADRIPAGVTYLNLNVIGTSDASGGLGTIDLTTEAGGVAMMVAGEKAFVSSDSGRASYRTLFTTVADRTAADVLYHCTAGKDRTGWASAALLTALGVPRDTVLRDYLLSNDYNAAANAATLAQVPAVIRPGYKAVLDVREEYLQSGFDEVSAKYGSFDGYLRTGLGLSARDLRALRTQLLVG